MLMKEKTIVFVLASILSISSIAQDFVPFKNKKSKKHIVSLGVTSFDKEIYHDSLIHYIDTIITNIFDTDNVNIRYKAVWNNDDTISYRERQKVIEYTSIDYHTKERIRILEVESLSPPHERHSIKIDGLSTCEITLLRDSMLYIPASNNNLRNNEQTCIFYALEAIFKNNFIDPEAIINRNSNCNNFDELNKFVDYFFVFNATNICRWKEIKKVEFPNNTLLVIKDAHNRFIHAVYYCDGLFHSKNGFSIPAAYSSIKPIIDIYSRWGERKGELSKDGILLWGNKIDVYSINRNIFNLQARQTAYKDN